VITAERWKEFSRGLSERSERYPRWGINCKFPRTPQGCEDLCGIHFRGLRASRLTPG
jgi:hypothetical protein